MSAITELTPGTWTADTAHSSVGFTVRHLVVSKVRGNFQTFDATLTVADDPLQSTVEANIDLASINTGDAGRDDHVKGGDFFDIEKYPTMTFRSTGLRPNGSDYYLDGELTIKDVTRPVTLDLEFNGVATDPWGGTRAGFSAETEVNRGDFGITYNAALEAGGVLIGEKLKVNIEVEAVKAA
jgi:polyisoprenoid-binding protein YceI